jgi:hypothetical protein
MSLLDLVALFGKVVGALGIVVYVVYFLGGVPAPPLVFGAAAIGAIYFLIFALALLALGVLTLLSRWLERRESSE